MDKVILLIDDDVDEHELFLDALKSLGDQCIFLSASGTEEALQILDRITPDFIFLDINMPAKNGFACLSAIKHKNSCKNVPVEMYSTSITDRDKKKAMDLGAWGYLSKTESFQQLCVAVKEVLKAGHLI